MLVVNKRICVGAGSQSAPIVTPPRPAFLNHLHGVIAAVCSSVTPAPSYTLPPVGSHLVARRLGAVAPAVYAAPEYLAQNPVGRFEDGLAGHDLIGFSDLMSPRPPGDPFLGASTAGGQLVFTGNSPLGLTEAAEAGLGVATLPCYLAACRPGLTRIWPDRSQRYDLLAVMRQEVKRSARIRAVVDYLARHFRTQQSLLEGS